jgi:PAS domain S-box-containing protein
MRDIKKTKAQRLTELTVLRQRVVELEKSQIKQALHDDIMRASEEWYRLLFDNVSDAVFVHWGPDETMIPGRFIEVNDVACQRLGYTREELLQMSPHDIDAPETVSGIPTIMERLLKEKRVLWEGVHISKDGRRIPVEIHNCLFYSKEKSVILSTVRDITERRLAEEALQRAHNDLERLVSERTSELLKRNEQLKEVVERYRQIEESLKASEERYRSVVDHIGIGISLISPDMEILTLNNQMKKWFPNIDVSKRPICYKLFNDPPREQICSYCPTYKALQDGQVYESITETPAGIEMRNYRLISSPIKDMDGKIIAAIEMVEDITENKKAQEALRDSENKYRTIFETTGAATAIIEEDTTISLINTEFEKQSGYSKGEVEGKKSWTEFLVKDDLARMKEYHRLRRVDPEAVPRSYEFQFIDRKGHIRDIFLTVAMIPGTTKSVASLLDITVHKGMEEELKKERETFFTVLKNYPHGVALVDRNGINQYVNPEFTKITGYTLEDIPTGRDWFQKAYPVPEYRRKVIDAWKTDRVKTGIGVDRHFSITCKDGHVNDIEFRITFLENWSITVLNDITDRKRAEEALKKRERELEVKSRNLEEINTAMRVLLKQREKDKDELEENVLHNVRQLIMPYIEKLRMSRIEANEADYVSILESNLKDIVSPFSNKLSTKYLNLTPKEIQIANLIKEGKTTKEIAEILNTSPGTVEFHRHNIRSKLGLKNKKINIRSHLLTLS